MIKYSTQNISNEDIKSVTSALKRDLITQGKLNLKFEKKIKNLVKSKYCLTMNSASLLLACKAIGLKREILDGQPQIHLLLQQIQFHYAMLN